MSINIRELVNTREVTEAFNTLSRLTGYNIRVMDPSDPEVQAFKLGENLFEVGIYGRLKANVAFEPIANQNKTGNFEDMNMLVRDILTRAYEIDELAEAVQDSIDQIGNLLRIADMIDADVDETITVVLQDVVSLFESKAAFVAISKEPTETYNVLRLVAGKDVELIMMTDEGTDVLKSLNKGREGEELRWWKGNEIPNILSQLLDKPQHGFFTAPLKIPHQTIGFFGVAAEIDNTAMQQWLTIYMGMAAGAIAGTAWNKMQVELAGRQEILQAARRAGHHSKNSIGRIGVLLYQMNQAMKSGNVVKESDDIRKKLFQVVQRLSEMEADFRNVLEEYRHPREYFALQELMEELVKDTLKTYPDLQFNTSAVGPDLRPFSDRNDIYQAVWELIVNSADWTDGTGIVRISAREVEGEDIPVDIQQDKPFIRIDFYNNGPCIPLENRERIFRGYTTRQGGTGQGLMFARERVERNNGYLYATEPDGEDGAHFVLLLPIN